MESIEDLNKRLSERYGKYLDGRPMFKIVFSEDEFVNEFGHYEDRTKEGLLIRRVSEFRERPKYRQYINPACYVLEKLTELLDVDADKVGKKTSYEPLWVFRNPNDNPLPPTWLAIEFLMEGYKVEKKERIVDPREEDADPNVAIFKQKEAIAKRRAELFGNETAVGDALSHKYGVVVPENKLLNKEKENG